MPGWAAHQNVRREERFAFLLGGDVLIAGALDVLAREPGERMLIVDYKSDRLDGADPAAVIGRAYATQRLVYALAGLRAGAATAVEVAYCFLECAAEPVVATFAPPDVRPAAGSAGGPRRRRAAGTVRGQPGASPGAVRGLPGRGRAVLVAAGHDPPGVSGHAVLTPGAAPARLSTGSGWVTPQPTLGLALEVHVDLLLLVALLDLGQRGQGLLVGGLGGRAQQAARPQAAADTTLSSDE